MKNNRGIANPALVAAVGVAVLLVGTSATMRFEREHELDRAQHAAEFKIPEVNAAVVTQADRQTTLTLPGDVQPVQNIPIFARVNGYLSQRLVDIGDVVKAGQLLAVIDTPELDQQVRQAQANLQVAEANLQSAISDKKNFAAQMLAADAAIKQAHSNLDYSSIEIKRYQKLAAEGAISWEQRDQALKQVNVDTAQIQVSEQNKSALSAQVDSADSRIAADKQAVEAGQAALHQLTALQSFQRVVAPSDGVITNRLVDAGALVAAGGNSGTTQLLTMAKTDVLRIYVDVPQDDYKFIGTGHKASIFFQEFPGKEFVGNVTNLAGSLNSNSRTLQTEIRVDNHDHLLKPGSYADVKFVYNNSEPPKVIPSNAAITKNDGLYADVVSNGTVHVQKITVARDFGNKLQISAGLKAKDVVLLDAPDSIHDGSPVKPIIAVAK